MHAADLHRLSRMLRDVALAASGDPGEQPTYGEIAVVEDLARHGPAAVGEIAQRTGVAQSLVSKVVGVLADAGVVERASDPTDARRRLVALSPGVRERLLRPRGARPVAAAITRAVPGLTPEDAARAEALLAELSTLLAPSGE